MLPPDVFTVFLPFFTHFFREIRLKEPQLLSGFRGRRNGFLHFRGGFRPASSPFFLYFRVLPSFVVANAKDVPTDRQAVLRNK